MTIEQCDRRLKMLQKENGAVSTPTAQRDPLKTLAKQIVRKHLYGAGYRQT